MADFDILYQLLTRSKNIPKDPCFDLEPKQFGKISFCFSHLKTKKKWNSTLVLEQYQWWIPMGRTVYLRTFTIEINHSWIGNIIPFIPWESYIQQHPCMVCIVYIDHILPLKTNQILVNIPVPWMVWVKSPSSAEQRIEAMQMFKAPPCQRTTTALGNRGKKGSSQFVKGLGTVFVGNRLRFQRLCKLGTMFHTIWTKYTGSATQE